MDQYLYLEDTGSTDDNNKNKRRNQTDTGPTMPADDDLMGDDE